MKISKQSWSYRTSVRIARMHKGEELSLRHWSKRLMRIGRLILRELTCT